MMEIFDFWLIGLLAVLSCFAVYHLTDIVRVRLVKNAVMDMPNERSMHAVPTPRGGGLAFLPLFFLACFFLTLAAPEKIWILLGLALLTIVSFADDKRGLSPMLRLGAHMAAAALGVLALGDGPLLFPFLPPFADRILTVIGWTWFINLTNFMDGIDGITGTQGLLNALGIIALLGATETLASGDAVLGAVIIGSCAGFLIHNWHPAKIFMGDAGSIPLGFLIGYLLLHLASSGFWLAALILPAYYLADSGITLTRRALRGEKIWRPHREHFYQKAAAGDGRHDRVVLWIAAADLLLIGCAFLSLRAPLVAALSAMVIVALLLFKMHKRALSLRTVS